MMTEDQIKAEFNRKQAKIAANMRLNDFRNAY